TDLTWLGQTTELKISLQPIKYLGVKLTSNPDNLYAENNLSIINTLLKDLDTWHEKPISWIGRLHSIKMNLMPCFLFLFEALPIKVTKEDLKMLQTAIDDFIWARK
ncbi:Hypothetical predicted protein, partial [Pelobates cultripes]